MTVLDGPGQTVGTIIDVRLATDADLDDHPGAPEIFGLVVSPRTRSSYLGYERSDVRRPAVLAAFLRRRHRGTFLALWADVARIDHRSVTLRPGFNRYSAILHNDT
jgi:hypothetical protein